MSERIGSLGEGLLRIRELAPESVKPYLDRRALAAFLLGVSSGFPYAMIAATLTTRLADSGLSKKTVTAFALAFLVYNFKVLWAWMVDGVRIPILHTLGQRRSWLVASAALVIFAVSLLGILQPTDSIIYFAYAAVFVGFAGATFDIVIDAYRIEILRPEQLGVGAGMSQYGWRIGSAGAGAMALLVAERMNWTAAYLVTTVLAFPALLAMLLCGEPVRIVAHHARKGWSEIVNSIVQPFGEFLLRKGAVLVLGFILLHKIGDTVANLTFRLLFEDLGFSKDEIAFYDVGIGFWAYLIGIFLGGIAYAKFEQRKGVFLALILMAVSNFSFAVLAAHGHSNWGMAAAITFENISSGLGGVVLVAYFSALCNLQFTASQYALISACSSIFGRLLTGSTAGGLIEHLGYVQFYVLTALLALPGMLFFELMWRRGLLDSSPTGASAQLER